MSKTIFDLTSEDLEELVYGTHFDDFEIVEEIDNGTGRWTENVSSIIRQKSTGKYYSVNWQRGLTEYQEDVTPEASDIKEVFLKRDIRVKTSYVTEDTLKNTGIESNKIVKNSDVDSLRLISDEEKLNKEILNLKKVYVDEIVKALREDTPILNSINNFPEYKKFVADFLEELQNL